MRGVGRVLLRTRRLAVGSVLIATGAVANADAAGPSEPVVGAWSPMSASPGAPGSALASYPKVVRTCPSGGNAFTLDQQNKDVQFIAGRMPWYGPTHSPDNPLLKRNSRFTSFYDISGITEDPLAFRKVIELLVRRYKAATEAGFGPTKIVGFEPRGFIFGTSVAVQLGIPFVMIGKGDRLPGVVITSQQHDDNACIVRVGSVKPGDRVVLIDDLIASGGTAVAGMDLVHSLGAEVHEFTAVMAPSKLGGVERIHSSFNGKFAGVNVFTLLEDATVQTFAGKKMDYTPPQGTPRIVTAAEGRRIADKVLGGDATMPLWP